MKTLKILLLLFGLFCRFATAQVYHFEQYNVHNGLGQSQVSDIIQDQFGYIWLSTRGGGISRFDGINFKTYRKEDGLPANNISSIKIDNQKRLLIGSYRGFSVFDGTNFRNLTPKNRQPKPLRGVFSDKKHNIYAVIGKNGLGKFEGDSMKIVIKNDTSKASFISTNFDNYGNVFVANYKTIFQVKNQKYIPILAIPTDNFLYGFMFDKDNKLWIGTEKGTFIINQPNPNLSTENWQKVGNYTPFYMISTTSGDVWLGLSEGAVRIQKDGKHIRLTTKNGFTSAKITMIYEDNSGVIWLSADGDGVYKFTDSPFTAVNNQVGLPNNSIGTTLIDNDGKIWFGTFTLGLHLWDGEKIIKSYTKENGLLCNVVTSSAMDEKGNKYFGSGSCGFTKIDKNGKLTNYPSDFYGEKMLNSIVCGENNDVWLGTWGGVVLFDGKKFKTYSQTDGFRNTRMSQLLKIGKNELVVFGATEAYRIKDYQVSDFKELGVWENSRVMCSYFDEKNQQIFWGDMEEGIFVYDLKTKKKHNFSTKDGLSSNLIYNLIFDKNNHLWAGSEKGLDRILFDKTLKIKDIRYYGQGEGLSGVETNAMTTAIDKTGKLWVGTIAGAFQYHPEKDIENTTPLKIQLTEVKLLFDTTKLENYSTKTDKWHRIFENLVLPYNKNNLTFSYVGIYHKNPNEIVYQYKLEGFDEQWSSPTTKTEISYTNLPSGNYNFLVRASNNCGKWDENTLQYSFKIKPPFWKTWWFSLITLCGVIAGVYTSQRIYANYETRKVLAYEKIKQEAESDIRKQVAQDFHDEIGNRLAAITTQSNVLKIKLAESDNANQKIIYEIEENARKLYTDTKDFIWAIDPESNRLNELLMYIRDFGEKLFQYSEIEFEMRTEIYEKYENMALPAGWSIQIIMIFKEAMTNTLKHAQAKQVIFDYKIEDENYSFSLEDDGKGISFSTNGNSQKGISNMQRRAEKINAILEIKQRQPNGTIVRISGKIPSKTTS